MRERHIALDLPTEPQAPSVAFVPYNPGIVKTIVGLYCVVDTSYWGKATPAFHIGFDEVFRIQYVKEYSAGSRDLWLTRMNGQHAGILICDPLLPGITFMRPKTTPATAITVKQRRWSPVADVPRGHKYVPGDFVLYDYCLYRVENCGDDGRLGLSQYHPDARSNPHPRMLHAVASPAECTLYEWREIETTVPTTWGTFLGQVVRIGDVYEDRLQTCLVVAESETLGEYGRTLTMIELNTDPVPTVVTESCNVTIVPDYVFDCDPLAARHAKLLRASVKLRAAMSSPDGVKLVEKLMGEIS